MTIFASLTTFFHFAVSLLIRSKNSSGGPPASSSPSCAQRAAGAGPIVHDDLLPEHRGHLRSDHARENVRAATGSEGGEQPDCFGRIFLLGMHACRSERERDCHSGTGK